MARLRVTENNDGTLSIRVGGYVESVDPRDKTKEELYDAFKWIGITANVRLTDSQLRELVAVHYPR